MNYCEIKSYIIKESFKDSKGNVLIFCDRDFFDKNNVSSENEIFLSVDGGDCSEGVFEKVNLNLDDIKNILQWYGYNELYEMFEKWYKEVVILWE